MPQSTKHTSLTAALCARATTKRRQFHFEFQGEGSSAAVAAADDDDDDAVETQIHFRHHLLDATPQI